MKYLFTIITLIFTLNVFGQQTVKIKKQKIYEWGTPYPKHKEIFYVLRTDNSIKQGSYKLKAGKRNIIEGWYDNNLKDSIWIFRPMPRYTDFIYAQGYYKENKKTGIWNFSNEDGLEQQYDYSNDSLIFTVFEITDTVIPVLTDTGFVLRKVDMPPIFKEGESAKKRYMSSANHYFGYNLPKDIWIRATVQFEIDENGMTHNHKIIKGDFPEYNENALKVVKAIPNDWIPAKINGKKVYSIWTISLQNRYIMR